MAIPGWDGATRIVEGVGECPKLTNDAGDVLCITRITDRYIWGVMPPGGIEIQFVRSTGEQLQYWPRRISAARLAELNALAAAQPDGTWRARLAPDTGRGMRREGVR